jgi:nucleotide-binding universal stress UspA family protein
MGGELAMKLVVGYLATPGGADAMALGARLALTLGAQVEACIILPPDRALPTLTGTRDYEAKLGEQAEKWLAEALASVPENIAAYSHVTFHDSFADGLIRETARLEADAIVVGGSGGGLAGSYSLGSVVNELLHSAPVPVAVAPRGTRESKVDRVREVTCAIGQRHGADLLLEKAVRFSKAAGTPLRLVSLVALDPVFGALRGDDEAVRERALAHARQVLETAKNSLPEGFPVTARRRCASWSGTTGT